MKRDAFLKISWFQCFFMHILLICCMTNSVCAKDRHLVDTSKPRTVPDLADGNKTFPDTLYERPEISASFPGGSDAWTRFMQKNLNGSVPADNGAPGGTYTVVIEFKVNANGNLSDLRALTNHGYGMEREALRVMKNSPRWKPAFQNGKPVSSVIKQPITFYF